MSIYLAILIFGFLLVILLGSLGMFDLDFGDSDVDVDLDMDMDMDMDMDADVDFDMDMDMDADADADSGGGMKGSISPMSPFMIGFFCVIFGMVGFLVEDGGYLDDYLTLGVAVICGVVATNFFRYGLSEFLLKNQSSSLVKAKHLIGKTATMDIGISDVGKTGRLRVDTNDGIKLFMAKASHPIKRGELVRIKFCDSGVYFVEKLHGMEPENLEIVRKDVEPKKGLFGSKKGSNDSDKNDSNGSGNGGSSDDITVKTPQTVIYDQRNIEIKDSVVQRSDFGHKTGDEKEN